MRLQLWSILIFSTGLIACGKTSNLKFKESELRSLETPVNFSTLRKLVLNSNCISCHSGYKNYSEVEANAEKILASVESGRMPKNAPSLGEEEIDFIRRWIEAGKPEGESESKPSSEGEKIFAEILGPKCVQCHNPNGEARFLDLSSRQVIWEKRSEILNFDAPEKSYLVEVITDPVEPMPPPYSKLERLTPEEVKRITDWISRGLP